MRVIVPSIRENSFKRFVHEWKLDAVRQYDMDGYPVDATNIQLILMEDNPQRTFTVDEEVWCQHLSWEDIERDLGQRSWVVPRRSDTVRSYAYWKAWAEGHNGENGLPILTLDDDCYPTVELRSEKLPLDALWTQHSANFYRRTKWFNTLNSGKPRGIPFKNLGWRRDIVMSHGLWQNVLDYDAPTQLVDSFVEEFTNDNRIIPAGSYYPMCGMNVMWESDYTVLMYHLLMGQVDVSTMPQEHRAWVERRCLPVAGNLYKLPYDRFGDIWCGILSKKVIDHVGAAACSGTPYIHHDRASDPFTNLIKEAEGLKVNEVFWERVDRMTLTGEDVAICYRQLGQQMGEAFKDVDHTWYFRMLGDAMVNWADLFIDFDIGRGQ